MDELSFCPYCSASSFKITLCKDNLYFCKGCNHFFNFEAKSLKCTKCDATNILKSEFPSPSGEAVFQCGQCKKAFPAKELLEANA